MNKANREKEQNLKEQSLKTGIISYIQWTGTNESTGQVSAFIQGKDTTTAEPMELPEGTATISFRLPDTTNSTGYKEVMIKTGDWIIKCTDNTMWTLADTEYQEYLITKTQEPTGTN
jgi:hypothetical protein